MSILLLIVYLVVFCAVIWAAQAILAAFSIAEPIRTLIWVAIVLIAIVFLLTQVAGGGACGGLHLGSLR